MFLSSLSELQGKISQLEENLLDVNRVVVKRVLEQKIVTLEHDKVDLRVTVGQLKRDSEGLSIKLERVESDAGNN